jgi:hypothetical protein
MKKCPEKKCFEKKCTEKKCPGKNGSENKWAGEEKWGYTLMDPPIYL